MLRIVPFGRDSLYLMAHGGRAVGRIHGATIRLGAFATERDAMTAALRGAHALDAHFATRAHDPADVAPDPGPTTDLRLVHDGAYEWIVRARRPIARLIRPHALQPAGDDNAQCDGSGTSDAAPRPALREWRAADASHALPSHCFALEFIAPASVPAAGRLTLARVLHEALCADAIAGGPSSKMRARVEPSTAPRAFEARSYELPVQPMREATSPRDRPPAA